MGWRDFGEWVLSRLLPDQETRKAEAALTETIERLVQEVSPAIRNIRGYRKRLRAPVEGAQKYIEGLVAAIPGPRPLSVEQGGRDSLTALLFVDADQLRGLFNDNAELISFFQDNSTTQAVALLTASCNEKTIFTSVLQGEIIRRDVPQTAVDFTEHRIVAPAETETLNRRALSEGGLRLLGLRALEHLTNLKSQKEDLAEEKRMVGIKLKILQAHDRSLEGLLESGQDSAAKAVRVREMLAEIDQELDTVTAVLGTPEDALNHLLSFLNNPEYVLTIQPLSLRLNWMGVKVEENAADPGTEIALAELEIKDRAKRVALLVTINRKEIMVNTRNPLIGRVLGIKS
jgi:hypothetical protein